MTTLTALAIILIFCVMLLFGLLSVLRELVEKAHDEPVFRDGDEGSAVGDVSQPNS